MAKKKETARPKRKRRGLDEQIAALEAKIVAIKEREARRRAKADPARRLVGAALKSIDKALGVVRDAAEKRALSDARAALTGAFETGKTIAPAEGRGRRSAAEIENLADRLLQYVRSNPGQRGEEIAAALATDSAAIRPVMKKLIAAGQVTTEGQKRGTTYTAT